MMISETRSFEVGPYRVQQKPHPDNPAWPVYIVFRGERYVGKNFSVPDLDCCRWLERWGTTYYADPSPPRVKDYGYSAINRRRRALAK